MITRWNLSPAEPEETDDCPLYDGMLTSDSGEWVRYEEHADRVYELEAQLQRVQALIDDSVDGRHGPGGCGIYAAELRRALSGAPEAPDKQTLSEARQFTNGGTTPAVLQRAAKLRANAAEATLAAVREIAYDQWMSLEGRIDHIRALVTQRGAGG